MRKIDQFNIRNSELIRGEQFKVLLNLLNPLVEINFDVVRVSQSGSTVTFDSMYKTFGEISGTYNATGLYIAGFESLNFQDSDELFIINSEERDHGGNLSRLLVNKSISITPNEVPLINIDNNYTSVDGLDGKCIIIIKFSR